MPSDTKAVEAVAIDGPAGAGKSTIARAVAGRLHFLFVDTGAMYRAVTLAAVRAGTDLADPEAMGAVARASKIDFDETGRRVCLDGEDVSDAIRTADLTRKIRHAAAAAPVREELVARQRRIAESRPVVMEGRDITTVVLPDARWKFYLDASVQCRAERRLRDLSAQGDAPGLAALAAEIEARDRSDFDRPVGPLKRTGEQIYLDTSDMTPEEVTDALVRTVNEDR
jgi:CMP/dCMP kinase